MCEASTDHEDVVMTSLKPSGHNKFKVQIECDTMDFVLTQDKCDNIMNTIKKKCMTLQKDTTGAEMGQIWINFTMI